MAIVRFVVPVALIVGFALADGVLAPALAQETNTESQTAPAPVLDQTAARIKYLHDRLRITAEQESLWEVVAQAIRESAEGLAPLRREQFRATTNGTALELLHSDEALGDAQLDSLKKIIAAFDGATAGRTATRSSTGRGCWCCQARKSQQLSSGRNTSFTGSARSRRLMPLSGSMINSCCPTRTMPSSG
jgi:hypothetical protein